MIPFKKLEYEKFWKIPEYCLNQKLNMLMDSKKNWNWNDDASVTALFCSLLQELENVDVVTCNNVVYAIDFCIKQLLNRHLEDTVQAIFHHRQIDYIFKRITERSSKKNRSQRNILNSMLPFEYIFVSNILKLHIYSPKLKNYVVKIAEDLVIGLKYSTINNEIRELQDLFLAFDELTRQIYLKDDMKPPLLKNLLDLYTKNVDYFGEFRKNTFNFSVISLKNILGRRDKRQKKEELKCKKNKKIKKLRNVLSSSIHNVSCTNVTSQKSFCDFQTQTPKSHLFKY